MNRGVLGGYRLHANINQKSRVTWFKLNGCNAEIMKGIIALHCNIGHNALPPNYLRKLKTGKWLTLYLGLGPCCQSLCLTFCGNWGGGFLSTARLGQEFHNWHFYNQHPPERWCDVRWWVGGGKVAGGKSKEKCWLKINCLVKDFSSQVFWWMFMNCNADHSNIGFVFWNRESVHLYDQGGWDWRGFKLDTGHSSQILWLRYSPITLGSLRLTVVVRM